MLITAPRDRAARNRATRPGARVPLRGSVRDRVASPADLAAVYSTGNARAALADAAATGAVFGIGSPQYREAITAAREAMTRENAAHVRAEVDRARRRRSVDALHAVLGYLDARRDSGTGDTADYLDAAGAAAAALRSLAELDALSTTALVLLREVENTVPTWRNDSTDNRADVGPPVLRLVDTLTAAPVAPPAPALSAR